MNSPVFLVSESTELATALGEEEFAIGTLPRSKIAIGANLNDLTEYHTAILGVTLQKCICHLSLIGRESIDVHAVS
jgi:hypothetical protein